MSDIATALEGLARVRDPKSQGMLATGITELCVATPLTARAEPIAAELLLILARKAEESVRIAMANTLADCDWAPHDVVRFLAFDAPSIAQHVILRSLCLTEADLIEICETMGVEHRCIVADRPGISATVSEAVSRQNESDVVSALASNKTAVLTDIVFERCVSAATDIPAMGTVLSHRPDLPEAIARKLYACVSDAVRKQLTERFSLASEKLTPVTEFATESARIDTDDESAAKLIEKLQFAGTLNGGVAVKALSEGRETLFDHAIAALCGLTPEDWRKSLASSGARTIALACRAARIDRSVYPTVLKSMQNAGRVHDGIEDQAIATAARIFRDYTPGKAHDSLRRIADSV